MNMLFPLVIILGCGAFIVIGLLLYRIDQKARTKAEIEKAAKAMLEQKNAEYNARQDKIRQDELDAIKMREEAEAKLRTWVITEDKMEDILMLADELQEHRNGTNHYRLWTAIHELLPETNGVKARLSYDGMTLTVKEVL